MQFDNITAFIDMGGHGFFVWFAYGLSIAVLAGNWVGCGLKLASIIKGRERQVGAGESPYGDVQ